MNTIKKIVSLALCCMLIACLTIPSFADSEIADNLHYIPTEIEVERNSVTVRGYFVNLNKYHTISNLREYEMAVYLENDILVSGNFGTIHQFEVEPLGVKYQSFTYTGNYGLNCGTYSCDDTFYAKVACRFSCD